MTVHEGKNGTMRFDDTEVRLYTRIKKNGRWTFRAVKVMDYLFESDELPGLKVLVHGVQSIDLPEDEP